MDACVIRSAPYEDRHILALPAEIRIAILEYVFAANDQYDGFKLRCSTSGIMLDEAYAANVLLEPLLACRQFNRDGGLLAFSRTSFVINNLFVANSIPDRLATLHRKQVDAIRSITFVADAGHFRKLVDWGRHPFGIPSLELDTLTIVLHRSSFWHYLFDFTTGIARLLRHLQGVKCLVFVRNQALVKGSFKTWYNRLIGLMLKIDHHERYDRIPCSPEAVWWKWSYDDVAQSFCSEAQPPKQMLGEEAYMEQIRPLMEDLKVSIENEEWNPDPRSRNGA